MCKYVPDISSLRVFRQLGIVGDKQTTFITRYASNMDMSIIELFRPVGIVGDRQITFIRHLWFPSCFYVNETGRPCTVMNSGSLLPVVCTLWIWIFPTLTSDSFRTNLCTPAISITRPTYFPVPQLQ